MLTLNAAKAHMIIRKPKASQNVRFTIQLQSYPVLTSRAP
jgi:hypothetical protein